jgi:pimeloyl-ACP methyl ester carboxylesterase
VHQWGCGRSSWRTSPNATALARHLPTATVTVYPDSGHGAVFQNHRAFVDAAPDFLAR